MASTVPGVDRESIVAKLGIGVQAPDLTGLAAPTISLAPVAPGGKLGQLRGLNTSTADRALDVSPTSGDSFAAALAKAVAARKADAAGRASAARQPRVEPRQERENAVRDVVRQLKQLVDAARGAKASNGTPLKQSGQATNTRDLEIDAAALRGAFERLTGTEANADAAAGEEVSLSSQQQADVEALLQTVAEVIAQAMTPDGEVDEAALVAALLADPLALAAAEALIAALQAQLVTTRVALPATQTDGEVVVGESGGGSAGVVAIAAQPGETRAGEGRPATGGATLPTETANAEALTAPVAVTAGEVVSPQVSAPIAASVDGAAEAVVATVESKLGGESTPLVVTPTAAQPPYAQTVSSAVSAMAETVSVVADEAVASVESVQAAPSASAAATEATRFASAAPAAASESDAAVSALIDSAEVSAPAPTTNGEQVVSTVAQSASGQNGAQAGADGQAPGEGDAFATGPTSAVSAARAAALSQTGAGADADGVVPTGQAAQNAAGAQGPSSSSSAGANPANATSTAPTLQPGSTAPAARAESVAQPRAAQESTPDVELHEQVSPVIVRQARLIGGNGGHELTVRLSPDHLGPLHVRISLVEGALSVGLTTASSEAQRALENALPQLRGALVDSGLRLERLDVSQRDAGNGGSGGNGGQSGSQRGSANAGRNGGQAGYTGSEGRQSNDGPNGGTSFADVLLDQDGRAFGASGSAGRGARWLGYRAYRRA